MPISKMGVFSMRLGLVFFLGAVAIFGIVLMTRGGQAPANAGPNLAEQKQAVLSYKVCDKGHALGAATTMTLKNAQAQSVGPIDYVSHDATQARYEIPYTARNGAEKTVGFTYVPSTGKVNAGNDDGLAVLELMKVGCR
jgi:hypothetical protein